MIRNQTLIICIILLLSAVNSDAQHVDMPTRWTGIAQKQQVPWSAYPRPQFQRKEWLCLNGWWDYVGGKDQADAGEPARPVSFRGKTERIHVPFCPESALSGIKRNQEINMWYKRSFLLPASWKNKKLLLHFEAVDHLAYVFINGNKAGGHAGGYDGFTIDITSFIHPGNNEIILAAKDENNGETPSGKNGPRGDYTFTSGIWQSVWLEPVEKTYIRSVKLLPDIASGRLMITVDAEPNSTLTATAFNHRKQVSSVTSSKTIIYLPIKNAVYWTPDHPFLYDLEFTLKDASGKITDRVSSYFGMREMKLGKVNGVTRPLLNGKFLMQLGLLDQGYWPDGILTAPTDEALKSDLLMAKNAGFNLIRKHMKTEPQRFYYWADKLGLMVWQDMPAIWYQDKDTTINRPRFRKELKAVIDAFYNSPCIVSWVDKPLQIDPSSPI